MLQFVHRVIGVLAEVPGCAEQALQMFLTGALAASEEACLEIIAYEFFEQVREPSQPASSPVRDLAHLGYRSKMTHQRRAWRGHI